MKRNDTPAYRTPLPAAARVNASVAVATGVTLDYVEQGPSWGVPIVFLHGYADSRRSFDLLLPNLPAPLRVFAISQRGHGDSSKPRDGYTSEQVARDVAAFLDASNVRAAIVVGHSMGAQHAVRFALDYPGRTRGLVTIGGFAQPGMNRGVRDLWTSVVSTMTDPVDADFVREFRESTLAQAVPSEFLHAIVQESLKTPAHVWRAAWKGFMETDLSAAMQRISAPTLAIWGERDVFVPRAEQDSLSAAFPDSRLLIYSNAGHAVHWEEPARVAGDLVRFVEIVTQLRAAC
jgi:pimeloyl-ACP methyl ester carboxylesterase